MMRALVLYHSLYGNTRRVAESLARGMRFAGLSVDCLSIREVVIGDIPRYDLLAIGCQSLTVVIFHFDMDIAG